MPDPLLRPRALPATPLATVRLIVLLLAVGTLGMGALLGWLAFTAPVRAEQRMLAVLVPALGLGCAGAYVFLRRLLVARLRAERAGALALLAEERCPPAFLQLTLLGCALAEGVGLFGALGAFLGGSRWLLALALLAVLLILAQWPTRARGENLTRGDSG